MPASSTELELGTCASTSRASYCSERLRTNRGQSAAPGMSSLSAASIWQPLHTPRVNVASRSKKALNSSRAKGIEQDRFRPAFAGAEHIAIGEAAAGDEAVEPPEPRAPLEDVGHVHIVGIESRA